MSNFEKILDAPVNVRKLIDNLDFAEEDLVNATLHQPKLFLEASRYRVKKLRKKIQARTEEDSVTTRVSLKYRVLKEKGKKSLGTESAIKDRVAAHPDVIEAKSAYADAVIGEEWASSLARAYEMRGKACDILCRILTTEAAAEHKKIRMGEVTDNLKTARENLRKRYPGEEE